MRTSTKSFLFAIGLAGIAVFFFASMGFAAPKYKWSFAQPWSRPLSNKGYEFFCDKVKEYSDGQIEIKFQPDGLLGTHDESFHGVRDGNIEVAVISPYVNLVPGGMLNWMPWTVGTFAEAKRAYAYPDGILFKVMQKAWNEVDCQLLFNVGQGPYGLANNARALKTPEDLKNLKMRVSSSLGFVLALKNMAEGTGMTMETIPWAEIYNALSRGVVDGCWDMWPSLVDERHAEVMKHFTDLQWSWDSQGIVINKALWDSLEPSLQEAIMKAAQEAETMLYDIQEKAQNDYIAALRQQKNFTITELSEEERDVWRNKARMEGIWKELCDPWLEKHYPGANMGATIQAELAKIREENKK